MEMLTSIYLLLAQGRGGRATESACGQDARDVALVVGRTAAVAVGRAVRCGHLAALREQLLGRRLADERVLRSTDVHGRRADGAARDAGERDLAALDAQRSRRRDDREVACAT